MDVSDSAWYKFDKSEIHIAEGKEAVELRHRSAVVRGLKPMFQARIYVPLDSKEKANKILG